MVPTRLALAVMVAATLAAQSSRDLCVQKASAAMAAQDLPGAIGHLHEALRLTARERAADPELERALAAAYTRLGSQHAAAARLDEAARCYVAADQLLPGRDEILASLGVIRLRQGRERDARLLLERAIELAPGNASAHAALGELAHRAGDRDGAQRHFGTAARLEPHRADLQHEAERSEKDARVEQDFTWQLHGSFRIHFKQRGQAREAAGFAAGILQKAHRELRQALGGAPDEVIDVVLYTNDEFARVRTADSWAHAYFDGRLRIPIGPWPAGRSQLEVVLRHELTHAFLRSRHPRVPLWVNEGYAQLFEGRTAASAAGVFRDRRALLPPEVFEDSFTRDPADVTTIERGYAQSLLCVAYLQPRGGLARFRQFLALVGSGTSSDAALQEVYRIAFADLPERALAAR